MCVCRLLPEQVGYALRGARPSGPTSRTERSNNQPAAGPRSRKQELARKGRHRVVGTERSGRRERQRRHLQAKEAMYRISFLFFMGYCGSGWYGCGAGVVLWFPVVQYFLNLRNRLWLPMFKQPHVEPLQGENSIALLHAYA